ncbi:MAG: response regulator transcription factor [Pseudomonadota bacterium]
MMNPLPKTVRVLLVDDHAVVRAGYRVLLADAPDMALIAEADTGELACQRYVEEQPDVVVMDVSLPGISGLEAARRILMRDAKARIIVFSMHEESAFVHQALSVGVKGYVTKGGAPELLVEAVRQVVCGGKFLDPRLGDITPASDQRAAIDALSPREFSIFRLLAEGHGNSEIGQRLRLSEKTVANYATQIRKKLGVQNRTELVYFAVSQGVVDSPEVPNSTAVD